MFRRFFFFSLKKKFLPNKFFIVTGLRVKKKKFHLEIRRDRKYLIITKSKYINDRRFMWLGLAPNYEKITPKKAPQKVDFQKNYFRGYK